MPDRSQVSLVVGEVVQAQEFVKQLPAPCVFKLIPDGFKPVEAVNLLKQRHSNVCVHLDRRADTLAHLREAYGCTGNGWKEEK